VKEEAVRELNRIRPKEDSENGQTTLEAEAWEQAIEEAKESNYGSWLDLFKKAYLNRTIVRPTPSDIPITKPIKPS
jgi:hypothetical protein